MKETFLKPPFITTSMKLSKTRNTYCPFCRKHTEHNVALNKKRNPSSLTYGSKVRARRRGRARGKGNMGRYSKPAISQFKMTGKKTSKKTDLRFQCKQCKKTHIQGPGFRARKIEFK